MDKKITGSEGHQGLIVERGSLAILGAVEPLRRSSPERDRAGAVVAAAVDFEIEPLRLVERV